MHVERDLTDANGDGWLEFAEGDASVDVQVEAGGFLSVVLQWNQQFGLAGTNLDVFILDETMQQVLASGTDVQDGDDDPVDFTFYQNQADVAVTVHVAVMQQPGSAGSKNEILGLNFSTYLYGAGY
jgi:hypothetical protein